MTILDDLLVGNYAIIGCIVILGIGFLVSRINRVMGMIAGIAIIIFTNQVIEPVIVESSIQYWSVIMYYVGGIIIALFGEFIKD